ncbi:hypothetical protein F1C76_06575 [Geodermatophilaceae bacterium NBWT11]|nr:hypothetical protein F1C76_06575 [Geodermatophilaceae bacterium NBWT11]
MPEPDATLGLSDALEGLREELEQAWVNSRGARVRFRAEKVTVKVEALARTDTKAGGKVRWWLIEAGADRSSAGQATQTLELTLTPQLYDDSDEPGPLDVSGEQDQPGR